MTNALFIVTIILTNWVTDSYTTEAATGKRLAVTQHAQVEKRMIFETVTLCTNLQIINSTMVSTNSGTRTVPIEAVAPPPIPTFAPSKL